MSATFQSDCPHCSTGKVAFSIVSSWSVPNKATERFFAAKCGHCSGGVVGQARNNAGRTSFNMSELNGNLENHGVVLLRVWPKQDALAAPDHVPPNLANFFLQGLRALKTESWDAAGMMFRKVLDVATLSINPTTSKKTLVKRIDDMRASGALTKDLADWAHEIRTEGNEAAHEEEPFGREEAESLRDFCEYFLIYVYSLPKRIANKRIQS